jgi:mRNA interferase HigB
MKIHLVKEKAIRVYAIANSRSRSPLNHWLVKVGKADWNRPEDIMQTFTHADLLGNGSNRVVFDIGGNSYRMICKYWFKVTRVHLYIKWLGTHAEYTRLCAENLQYTIEDY